MTAFRPFFGQAGAQTAFVAAGVKLGYFYNKFRNVVAAEIVFNEINWGGRFNR
jgi:hypothetical protein